jgi:hypothetical protein
VRSCESHGGTLSLKKKKKIERDYGSFEHLLRLVLDYLRICIVVALLHQSNKEGFIDLVDDYLVDVNKREILDSMASRVKPYTQTTYDIMC